MNYKIIIFSLIFFCSLSSSMPVLHIQNNKTQPGETILATITTNGEFVHKIARSQIKFFQGRRQVSLESDIFFHNNTYYLYIYTSLKENVTLKIENILDKESGEIKSTTIIKNITISPIQLINESTNRTYTRILQIKPGFIFLSSAPKIKLTNVGSARLNINFNKEKISINPSENHEFEIKPNSTFSFINISSYRDFLIPVVYLKPRKSDTTTNSSSNKTLGVYNNLKASPRLFFVETFTDTNYKKVVQLFNFGRNNLTNLKASSSIYFLKVSELRTMKGRGIQNLTIKLKPTTPGYFSGDINVSYIENKTKNILKIPLSIFVLPKGTAQKNFQVNNKTCKEMSGKVCEQGMLCNGTAVFTKNEEYCCMGSCVQVSSTSSKTKNSGWMVAMTIFIILGLIGYYFYQKQKKVGSKNSPNLLNSVTKRFERRMAGNNPKKINKI